MRILAQSDPPRLAIGFGGQQLERVVRVYEREALMEQAWLNGLRGHGRH